MDAHRVPENPHYVKTRSSGLETLKPVGSVEYASGTFVSPAVAGTAGQPYSLAKRDLSYLETSTSELEFCTSPKPSVSLHRAGVGLPYSSQESSFTQKAQVLSTNYTQVQRNPQYTTCTFGAVDQATLNAQPQFIEKKVEEGREVVEVTSGEGSYSVSTVEQPVFVEAQQSQPLGLSRAGPFFVSSDSRLPKYTESTLELDENKSV